MLVVGNPANTNALIAMSHAPDVPRERFTAMMRLDHNRAKGQLAAKAGVGVAEVTNMTVWGNHSATQYPDIFHAQIGGRPAAEVVADQAVGRGATSSRPCRGAAPRSSRRAARRARRRRRTRRSTTCATGWRARPTGDWVSMAVPSDGSYGVPEGILCGFPVRTAGGDYTIVEGLEIDAFSRARIDASAAELRRRARRRRGQLGLLP